MGRNVIICATLVLACEMDAESHCGDSETDGAELVDGDELDDGDDDGDPAQTGDEPAAMGPLELECLDVVSCLQDPELLSTPRCTRGTHEYVREAAAVVAGVAVDAVDRMEPEVAAAVCGMSDGIEDCDGLVSCVFNCPRTLQNGIYVATEGCLYVCRDGHGLAEIQMATIIEDVCSPTSRYRDWCPELNRSCLR